MTGKRVQFDQEKWGYVDLLCKDRMMTFQELADEAFGDILKKIPSSGKLERGAAKKRRGLGRNCAIEKEKGRPETQALAAQALDAQQKTGRAGDARPAHLQFRS